MFYMCVKHLCKDIQNFFMRHPAWHIFMNFAYIAEMVGCDGALADSFTWIHVGIKIGNRILKLTR